MLEKISSCYQCNNVHIVIRVAYNRLILSHILLSRDGTEYLHKFKVAPVLIPVGYHIEQLVP